MEVFSEVGAESASALRFVTSGVGAETAAAARKFRIGCETLAAPETYPVDCAMQAALEPWPAGVETLADQLSKLDSMSRDIAASV